MRPQQCPIALALLAFGTLAALPAHAQTPAATPGPAAPAAAPPAAAPAPTPAPPAAAPAPTPAPPAAAPAANAEPAQPEPPKAPKKPLKGVDGLPGSPRPLGPSLSPEAPPRPPAPGGRAPSFGAPMDADVWSFRLGGRIQGYTMAGFAENPLPAKEGQSESVIHVPARIDGRLPFSTGASLTLNLAYGTSILSAFVNYTINTVGKEWAGLYHATNGNAANSAYILLTPQPLGPLRLQVKVGAFTESYAGTGQWGWGVLGPLIGTRGYGELITGEYDLTPEIRLFGSHGLFAVPGVAEFFVRGTYSGWNETGVSTMMQHAHLGLSYKGKYTFKLHMANAAGTDEREYLAPGDFSRPIQADPRCSDVMTGLKLTPQPSNCYSEPRDGRIDAYAAEAHVFLDQWGHLGLAGAYYNLVTANAVHDGIWWTVDWTQGGRETVDKYIGLYGSTTHKGGTGEFFALSAQYDFSLANLLWHPKPFDGRGPDVRAAIAGIYHYTVDSDNPFFGHIKGYQLGIDIEYRMLPWLSATLRGYGTSRNPSGRTVSNTTAAGSTGSVNSVGGRGHYSTHTITPGLVFRSDWQASERIEIAYSRLFYSDFTDSNPVIPFDRNVLTVGATMNF